MAAGLGDSEEAIAYLSQSPMMTAGLGDSEETQHGSPAPATTVLAEALAGRSQGMCGGRMHVTNPCPSPFHLFLCECKATLQELYSETGTS